MKPLFMKNNCCSGVAVVSRSSADAFGFGKSNSASVGSSFRRLT